MESQTRSRGDCVTSHSDRRDNDGDTFEVVARDPATVSETSVVVIKQEPLEVTVSNGQDDGVECPKCHTNFPSHETLEKHLVMDHDESFMALTQGIITDILSLTDDPLPIKIQESSLPCPQDEENGAGQATVVIKCETDADQMVNPADADPFANVNENFKHFFDCLEEITHVTEDNHDCLPSAEETVQSQTQNDISDGGVKMGSNAARAGQTLQGSTKTGGSKIVYERGVCSQQFASVHEFEAHKMSHKSKLLRYKCEECGEMLLDIGKLQEHRMKHKVKRKRYTCEICGEMFISLSELRKHRRRHPENPFKCNVCGERLPNVGRYMEHRARHKKKIYKCNICFEGFLLLGQYRKHIMQHAKKTYACNLCGKEFEKVGKLRAHKTWRHTKKVLKCDICGKQFSEELKLQAHKTWHTRKQRKCRVCGKQFFGASALHAHKLLHAEKSFKCDVCGKVFFAVRKLQLHKKWHQRKPRDISDKPLTRIDDLEEHKTGTQKNAGTQKKTFSCDLCGEEFPKAVKLRAHKTWHVRHQFKCEICDKEFFGLSKLNAHKIAMHVKKAFKCDICGKEFCKYFQLQIHTSWHRRRQRDITGEPAPKISEMMAPKPGNEGELFECDICGEQFPEENKLKTHKSWHLRTQYRCNICGKHFFGVGTLRAHELLHVKKSHKCDVCGKAFSGTFELQMHKSWHVRKQRDVSHKPSKDVSEIPAPKPQQSVAGDVIPKIIEQQGSSPWDEKKSFECDVCGQQFPEAINLKAHKRWHLRTTYRCNVCGQYFFGVGSLRTHKLCHVQKSHKCDVCGKTFSGLFELRIHKTWHVRRQRKVSDGPSSDVSEMLATIPILDVSRDTIPKILESEEWLERKSFQCDICDEQFPEAVKLRAHKTWHSRKQCTCDLCGKEFFGMKKLHDHKMLHVKKSHKCDVCGKEFSELSSLQMHKIWHVTKSFTCDVCDKQFSEAARLQAHKRWHTRGHYKCYECGKLFSGESPLHAHKLRHIKKPHKCDICDKEFSGAVQLGEHKTCHARTQHDIPNRPFTQISELQTSETRDVRKQCKCDICGKCFPSEGKLRSHHISHIRKRHDCEVCGKHFPSSSKLHAHKTWHGKKQYKYNARDERFFTVDKSQMESMSQKRRVYDCDLCGQQIVGIGKIRAHKTWHKRKAYKCDICGERFANIGKLRSHRISKHDGRKRIKKGEKIGSLPIDVSCESTTDVNLKDMQRLQEDTHETETLRNDAASLLHDCSQSQEVMESGNDVNLEMDNSPSKYQRLQREGLRESRDEDTTDSQYMGEQVGEMSGTDTEGKVRRPTNEKPRQTMNSADNEINNNVTGCSPDKTDHSPQAINEKMNIFDSIGSLFNQTIGTLFNQTKNFLTNEQATTVNGVVNSRSDPPTSGTTSQQAKNVVENASKKEKVCDVLPPRKVITKRKHAKMYNSPYKCKICDITFTWRYESLQHKRTHTEERPYKCDICGRTFSVRNHLKTHYRNCHEGKRCFECDICGKKLGAEYTLMMHKRTHTGTLKVYNCKVCDKEFWSAPVLKAHEERHVRRKSKVNKVATQGSEHLPEDVGEKFGLKDKQRMREDQIVNELLGDVENDQEIHQNLSDGSAVNAHGQSVDVKVDEEDQKMYEVSGDLQDVSKFPQHTSTFNVSSGYSHQWEASTSGQEQKGNNSGAENIVAENDKLVGGENSGQRFEGVKRGRKKSVDELLAKHDRFKNDWQTLKTNIDKELSACSSGDRSRGIVNGKLEEICGNPAQRLKLSRRKLHAKTNVSGNCPTPNQNSFSQRRQRGQLAPTKIITGKSNEKKCGGVTNRLMKGVRKSRERHIVNKKQVQEGGIRKPNRRLLVFGCNVCDKTFPRRGLLNKHQLTHVSQSNQSNMKYVVKPAVCKLCHRTFKYHHALRAHMISHSNIRSFKCHVCSAKFLRNGALQRHIKIHTGDKRYVCDVCSKKFIDRSALAKHEHTHTGDKPYKCDVCGRAFAAPTNLKRHSLVHSGEKRHVCHICGARYADNRNLKRHKKVVHGLAWVVSPRKLTRQTSVYNKKQTSKK